MSAPSSSNSLTGAAILAAHGGSVAVLRELLENPSAKALLTTLEAPPALLTDKLMPYVNGGSAGQSYCLLRQPPVVIAACRLHLAAVKLLLQSGATLPERVGDGGAGTIPLLAFWVGQLRGGGDRPGAVPMLRLLCRAGADPLATGTAHSRPELAVGGRVGSICSFLLTCHHPPLLAAAVRIVLDQCSAVGSGGRELSPPQVAVMLVAARIAGLEEESQQLMAQAAISGNCFPSAVNSNMRAGARPGSAGSAGAARHSMKYPSFQCRPASAGEKRRRETEREGGEEEEEEDYYGMELESMGAAGTAGYSDSESDDSAYPGAGGLPPLQNLLSDISQRQLVRQPWMEYLYQQHATAAAALARGRQATESAEARVEDAARDLARIAAQPHTPGQQIHETMATDVLTRANAELAHHQTVEESLNLRLQERHREMAAHVEQERRQGRSVYYSNADFATDPFGPPASRRRRLSGPAAGGGNGSTGNGNNSNSNEAGPSTISVAAMQSAMAARVMHERWLALAPPLLPNLAPAPAPAPAAALQQGDSAAAGPSVPSMHSSVHSVPIVPRASPSMLPRSMMLSRPSTSTGARPSTSVAAAVAAAHPAANAAVTATLAAPVAATAPAAAHSAAPMAATAPAAAHPAAPAANPAAPSKPATANAAPAALAANAAPAALAANPAALGTAITSGAQPAANSAAPGAAANPAAPGAIPAPPPPPGPALVAAAHNSTTARRRHLARILRSPRGYRSLPREPFPPSEASSPAERHKEWHRRLRAQLVADAALHGMHDVLTLLLNQGASATLTVPWTLWHQQYPRSSLRQLVVPAPVLAIPRLPPHLAPLMPGGGERSPLALAAAAGHRSCVLLRRRHGASVDKVALRHAVWSLSAEGVEALLSKGCGRLPPSAPCSYAEGPLNCPILLLLQRHLEMLDAAADADPLQRHLEAAVAAAAAKGKAPMVDPADVAESSSAAARRARFGPLLPGSAAVAEAVQLGCRAVRIMDLLYDAGYRIEVYRDMCGKGPDGVWRMGRFDGLQPDELEKLEVSQRNRLLWEAYCRASWTRATHATFPSAFRATARMLLLVARWGEEKQRCRQRGGMQDISTPLQALEGQQALPGQHHQQQQQQEGIEEGIEEGIGEGIEEMEEGGQQAHPPAQQPSHSLAAASNAGASTSAAAGPSNSASASASAFDAGSQAGAVAAAAVARLPLELLHRIISQAAYPLSKWVVPGEM